MPQTSPFSVAESPSLRQQQCCRLHYPAEPPRSAPPSHCHGLLHSKKSCEKKIKEDCGSEHTSSGYWQVRAFREQEMSSASGPLSAARRRPLPSSLMRQSNLKETVSLTTVVSYKCRVLRTHHSFFCPSCIFHSLAESDGIQVYEVLQFQWVTKDKWMSWIRRCTLIPPVIL